MAVSAYLKVVADSLRRAAVDAQREIDELRHQIAAREREMHDSINAVENGVKLKEAELTNDQLSSIMHIRTAKEIADLKQELSQIPHAFNSEKATMQGMIDQIQHEIEEFKRLASQFEQRSASR